MSSVSIPSPAKHHQEQGLPYQEVDQLFYRDHTPEEARWLRIAREVSDEFAQSAPERYRTKEKPYAQIQRLHESGLATLLIRKEQGGGGVDWAFAVEIIREIAAGDGSLGVLMVNHSFGQNGLKGLPEPLRTQREREAVEQQIWFGNGGNNPWDPDIVATPKEGKLYLNGRKTFCTGGAVADRIGFMARRSDNKEIVRISISPERPGLTFGNDWDALGLPLADSGSITYDNVEIAPHEFNNGGEGTKHLFGPLVPLGPGAPTGHLAFSNVYLGIAIGALRAARQYIQTTTRPWVTSGVERAADDPYIIYQFGEFWAQVEAALAVGNQASLKAQAILNIPPAEVSDQARGEVAVAIATFKVLATRASVDITSKILELTGARSSAAKYGFDRFWRDARTYTLHNPYNYKVRELGDYALNGQFPKVTFYS